MIDIELRELEANYPLVDSGPMPKKADWLSLVARVTALENAENRVPSPPSPAGGAVSVPKLSVLAQFAITTAIGVVSLMLMIWFGVVPYIEKYMAESITTSVTEGLKAPNQDIIAMGNEIAGLDGEMKLIVPLVIGQAQKTLQGASKLSAPEFKNQLPQIAAAIGLMADQRLPANPNVQAISQKIVEGVSIPRPEQRDWNAFMQLIRYDSYVRAVDDPDYDFNAPNTAPPVPGVSFEGLTIVGGVWNIRGVRWKNVVVRNAIILYDGGPTSLVGVTFENCKFQMPITAPTVQLGKTILASNSVTFKQIG